MTDEELVIAYKAGDRNALELLCRNYKDFIAHKARCFYILGGDTQDIIQEGMIGLISAVNTYDPEKNDAFFPFASMCILRNIYKSIEQSERKKNAPLNDYVPMTNEEGEETINFTYHNASSVVNPESEILDKERAMTLEKSIKESLSAFEVKVFELCLKGESYVRIAEILEKTPKTIDNAIQRIRHKAKDVINNLE